MPEWTNPAPALDQIDLRISPVKEELNLVELYEGLEIPRPANFKTMTVAQVLQWYQDWIMSEEGKRLQGEIQKRESDRGVTQPSYNVIQEGDGSFNVVDVLPGEYTLSGKLRKADAQGRPDYVAPPIGEISHPFTVEVITPENHDVPVDLGVLAFVPPASLEPNQPAPDFNVKGSEDGRLTLADFRGRFLLLTFYQISETPDPEMRTLKRIQDAFGRDDRLAMVGLTRGGLSWAEELAVKYCTEQGLTWQQAFMETNAIVNEYHAGYKQCTFLIGPDGILLAKDLKGDDLYNAVAAALGR